jgi:hypothetical protein
MGYLTSIKALSLAAALTVTSIAAAADAQDPLVGTWVLNTAKSTCDPPPAPKSHVFIIASAPGGALHNTVDLVEGDGTKTHMEFTTARDGKYVPVTGSDYADSASLTQVNPKSFKYSLKKAGKALESGTFTLSHDGKTIHAAISGKGPDGAWKCTFTSNRQ